jgi:hypothetical protein
MALAAVKSSPGPAPPSLAGRVAEAQRAEVRPRNRVAELEAALQAAIDAKDYLAADRAQADLQPAREALAIAQGTTRGLAEGLAAAEAQRAADQRAVAEIRRREEAQRAIADAYEAEKRALDGIEEALAQLPAAVGAAQDAYRAALDWETRAGQARVRIRDARVVLGEIPAGSQPLPRPNRASVLTDTDPAIRALMRWRR